MENIFYKCWKRFLTWIGDIYFATKPPKVKAFNIKAGIKLMLPGDIICRKYNYYLDNYLIKGEYTHSGIVIDNNNVCHAVAEGVGLIDYLDYVKDADGFCILRPLNCDYDRIISVAVLQIGLPYDFMFNSADSSSFFCHELSYYCLKKASKSFIPSPGRVILYKDFIAYTEEVYKC